MERAEKRAIAESNARKSAQLWRRPALLAVSARRRGGAEELAPLRKPRRPSVWQERRKCRNRGRGPTGSGARHARAAPRAPGAEAGAPPRRRSGLRGRAARRRVVYEPDDDAVASDAEEKRAPTATSRPRRADEQPAEEEEVVNEEDGRVDSPEKRQQRGVNGCAP